MNSNAAKLCIILFSIQQLISINLFAALEGSAYDNPAAAPLITSSVTSIQLHVYDTRVWKFIPSESTVYIISTIGSSDSYGRLFNTTNFADENILAQGDDENGFDFVINYFVTAGTTYYILIYDYDIDNVCNLSITGGTLPVALTSFSANVSGSSVKLKWQTETEVNNYGFNVERRTKNGEWMKVGFVKGSGNCNSPEVYSFTDYNVISGNYSYRLKQIDNDGKYEYSKEVEVTLNDQPKTFELLQNYPNPFNPSTSISYQLPVTSQISLKVFDVIGNEVATLVNEKKQEGSYNVVFNASSLPSGIYFYRLKTCGINEVRKMLLVK